MSKDKYKLIEDLSEQEIYSLMDSRDRIEESNLRLFRGNLIQVALDSKSRIVAVGNYGGVNDIYFKAVARGCLSPNIHRGMFLPDKLIREHNKLLEESLANMAK